MSSNSNGGDARNGDADVLAKIHLALEVVHSPHSTNDARREAQSFLEEVKDIPEAPFQGYTLASDKAQAPVVRHYALSLLEHAIRYRWASYTDEQSRTLRNWVLELSQAVSKGDPSSEEQDCPALGGSGQEKLGLRLDGYGCHAR